MGRLGAGYVLIYLETSLMKLDTLMIQRLQSIVVEKRAWWSTSPHALLFQGRQGMEVDPWIQSHS